MRWRKLSARVFGPKLGSLGFVKERNGALLVMATDGTTRFVFKPLEKSHPEAAGRGGYMVYSPADSKEGEGLPEVESVHAWVVPAAGPGAWKVLDMEKAEVLTVRPEAPLESPDVGDDDLKWETAGESPDETHRLRHLPSGTVVEAEGDDLRSRAEALDSLKASLLASQETDATRVVSSESDPSVKWQVKVDEKAGRRRVCAHRYNEEGELSQSPELSTYSARLATLAFAPSLTQKFDPLLRAGLIRALSRL
jgi:hypothetical protein